MTVGEPTGLEVKAVGVEMGEAPIPSKDAKDENDMENIDCLCQTIVGAFVESIEGRGKEATVGELTGEFGRVGADTGVNAST